MDEPRRIEVDRADRVAELSTGMRSTSWSMSMPGLLDDDGAGRLDDLSTSDFGPSTSTVDGSTVVIADVSPPADRAMLELTGTVRLVKGSSWMFGRRRLEREHLDPRVGGLDLDRAADGLALGSMPVRSTKAVNTMPSAPGHRSVRSSGSW